MIDTYMQHVIYFSAADKDIRESLHESFNLTPVLVDIIKHTCSSAVNSLCMEVRGTDAYIAHLSINACMCTLGIWDCMTWCIFSNLYEPDKMYVFINSCLYFF